MIAEVDELNAENPGKETDVVRALEEDIIFGRLAQGERVTEDTLLARFPISRHLARQAISQLERQGLVVRERNKSAAVRSLSESQVRQIYDVREMLQRQAALMIPLPAPQELIDELTDLQALYREAIKARNLRQIHELNDAFHIKFFSACGNDYLVASIREYMRLTLMIRAKSLAVDELRDVSRHQHDLLIELLKGRDRWALAQLCVDHLRPSKEAFLGGASSPLEARGDVGDL